MWEEEGEVETANINHSKEKQKNEEKQGNRGQAEAEMRSGAPGCVCRGRAADKVLQHTGDTRASESQSE